MSLLLSSLKTTGHVDNRMGTALISIDPLVVVVGGFFLFLFCCLTLLNVCIVVISHFAHSSNCNGTKLLKHAGSESHCIRATLKYKEP